MIIGLCLALSRYMAHAADLHSKVCTGYINSIRVKMSHSCVEEAGFSRRGILSPED